MNRLWRRRLKRIGILTIAILVIVVTTLWLMFEHIPGWYRPVAFAPAEAQPVKDDLLRTWDQITFALRDAIGPFEYRLTQDQINAWFAVREEIWPLSRNWLPPMLANPFVVIEAGAIRLAATYRGNGLQTVISGKWNISADRIGVTVRLDEIAGGSLPIPLSWVRQQVGALDADIWSPGRRSKWQYSDDPMPPLSALLDEAVFPNAWIWENGRQPFRIVGLKAEPGVLIATIEPLPRHSGRRANNQQSSGPAVNR